MSPTAYPEAADLSDLVDPACALANRWLAGTHDEGSRSERQTAARLAALVRDPAGLELAVRFIDRVVRPESEVVAAKEFSRLRVSAGTFLAPADRVLLGAGSALGPVAPHVVVPLARARLRRLTGHLVADAEGPMLDRSLRWARSEGFRLNLNLLGQAVLGERAATERLFRTRALLARPGADYVSVKVSSLTSQISPWDITDTVRRVSPGLRELFRTAMAKNAFVNLDMEDYEDLDLTVATFTSIVGEPEFRKATVGLALQAYLPDTRAALEELLAFSRRRTAKGGTPIKVRIVKGANLSMERVEAELQGWTPAPYARKSDVDANFLALVDRAMSAEHGPGFRVGVASHNLYDIALAYLLARGRGVANRVDIEMLQGMAPAKARAVRDTVGNVILYTPVAAPDDFDVAVAYLIRRLQENAQPLTFLHALVADELSDQEDDFRRSVEAMRTVSQVRRRTPERPPVPESFVNTPNSDPALEEVRVWAAECVARATGPPTSPELSAPTDVDAIIRTGRAAGRVWAERSGAERRTILRRAADEIETRRGALVRALASEAGALIGEADPEVSQAVDFARWYADRAMELTIDGLQFTPHTLSVIVPPWNRPVALAAGGMLAALAAGSAVVVKPSAVAARCAEIIADALWAAGVPTEALQVVRLVEGELERTLIAHPGVDAVVLTGATETAERFLDWRSGRPCGHGVIADTSSKNAMIITAAADYDLAVNDLVHSAFGHAGQNCQAASLAILVGEAARSQRLRRQLIDAVTSQRVGWPCDPGVTIGPLVAEPHGRVARALTELAPGESWLVEPRALDDSRRLWSPGVRQGVRPGSWFHLTECFAPVLGVMEVRDLDEAITLQNQTAHGLTGALQSLDDAEIDRWLTRVEVGTACVNRPTTGAVVGRQPLGGWKTAVVGPGAKTGGKDYVAQLGGWTEHALPGAGAEPGPLVNDFLDECLAIIPDAEDRVWLVSAARSDALTWHTELGVASDLSGLVAEENTVRRLPAPLTVRGLHGARLVEVLRVALGAVQVGAPLRLSLEASSAARVRSAGWRLADLLDHPETDAAFEARAGDLARIRLVGPEAHAVANRLSAPGVATLAAPVLAHGRRELLSVLREQTVSRTRHRHGHLPAGADRDYRC